MKKKTAVGVAAAALAATALVVGVQQASVAAEESTESTTFSDDGLPEEPVNNQEGNLAPNESPAPASVYEGTHSMG